MSYGPARLHMLAESIPGLLKSLTIPSCSLHNYTRGEIHMAQGTPYSMRTECHLLTTRANHAIMSPLIRRDRPVPFPCRPPLTLIPPPPPMTRGRSHGEEHCITCTDPSKTRKNKGVIKSKDRVFPYGVREQCDG